MAYRFAWVGLAASVLIALCGCRDAWRAPGDLKIRQVTTSSGLDIFPSFSPDGNAIAYCSDRGGRFEIYVRQLGPGGAERQLTNDGLQNFQPAWSPDGGTIAYHSRGRGGIWLIPAQGGSPRPLTKFGSRPVWAPAGNELVFQSEPLVDVSANALPVPASTLWVVPRAGGEPAPLTRIGSPQGGHGSPAWSPDGRRVFFLTYGQRSSEIWSVARTGGELTRVVYNHRYTYDPLCTGTGDVLTFSSYSTTGTYELWSVRLGPGGKAAGAPRRIENLGQGFARHLTAAADGRKVAYSALRMSSNLVSLPVSAETGEATGPPGLLTAESGRNSRPSFSPDGRRIAYDKSYPGTNCDVWVMNADGSDPVAVTTDPGVDETPSWFPDGKALAFLSNRRGRFALLRADLTTKEESLLLDPPEAIEFVHVSPDGKEVAYHAKRGGRMNVWIAPLSGGKPRQLTFDDEMAGFPCWSPDARELAIEIKRGSSTQVALLPRAGGALTVLTTAPGQSWPHSFSPDGNRVAFAAQRDGVWNVAWVSVSTYQERLVSRYESPRSYARSPAWSPRGDQLVYEYAETTGNVWVIENWGR